MNIIYQGEDAILTFTIKDSSGTDINLTGYTNIIVWLIDTRGAVAEKYSRETKSGHNSSDFNQLNQTTFTGQFQLTVQDTITANLDEGTIHFEVKANDGTNVASDKVTETNDSYRLEVQRAKTKDITP